MNMFHDFFDFGIINASLNEIYVCVIPKKLDARMVFDYRPFRILNGSLMANELVDD